MPPSPLNTDSGVSDLLGYSIVTPRSARFGVWYVVDVEIRRVPVSIVFPRRVSSRLMWAKKAPSHCHAGLERNDMARRSGEICVCGGSGSWRSHCAS